jgi:hypothetical protein
MQMSSSATTGVLATSILQYWTGLSSNNKRMEFVNEKTQIFAKFAKVFDVREIVNCWLGVWGLSCDVRVEKYTTPPI